jgi:hypothetical protein
MNASSATATAGGCQDERKLGHRRRLPQLAVGSARSALVGEDVAVYRDQGHAVLQVELLVQLHLPALLVLVREQHHGLVHSIVGGHISHHRRNAHPAATMRSLRILPLCYDSVFQRAMNQFASERSR